MMAGTGSGGYVQDIASAPSAGVKIRLTPRSRSGQWAGRFGIKRECDGDLPANDCFLQTIVLHELFSVDLSATTRPTTLDEMLGGLP
jgi:hypothetical protein